jgi:hypothetical protein
MDIEIIEKLSSGRILDLDELMKKTSRKINLGLMLKIHKLNTKY